MEEHERSTSTPCESLHVSSLVFIESMLDVFIDKNIKPVESGCVQAAGQCSGYCVLARTWNVSTPAIRLMCRLIVIYLE